MIQKGRGNNEKVNSVITGRFYAYIADNDTTVSSPGFIEEVGNCTLDDTSTASQSEETSEKDQKDFRQEEAEGGKLIGTTSGCP